jgi:predicted exporter
VTPATNALPARQRVGVLAIWLLLLALAGASIWRTPFVADLSAFLPAKPDARQRVLIEQLQSGVAARTLFIGVDGGTDDQRVAVSRALAERMRASGLFEQVQNGERSASSGWGDIGTWLFEHRYQLSPAVNAQRFTPAGLRDGIDETLSLLGTPAGNAIKPLLERDPTGETQRIAESLIPTSAPRSDQGVWVSRQAPRAVLLANVAAAGADLDGQAAALASVRKAFAEATAGVQASPALHLRMSGAPVFSVDSRAQIEREVKALTIAGVGLMSVLLLLAFASLPALLVALLPVLTGVAAGVAVVGLVFGNVHGITLGFGSTLIGEAVDYGIYYLIQARGAAGAPASERGWRHWLATSWPTVRLGLATSVCGFAALLFSGFPGLAQLGVFSTTGLIAATLATRYVLPVLMPEGAAGQGARRWLGNAALAAVRVLPRLRRSLLALGIVAAGGLLWQRGELWRADLASLSPISKDAMALDGSLRADLTAGDGGSLVVVQGPDVQTTLERAERVGLQLDALVNQGEVDGYNSVVRWLPSLATQRQRLASLPNADTLRTALAEATAGGPLPARRLEPFIADVQAARALQPVTPESLQGSALAPLVGALLLQRPDGSWAALLPVQTESAADPRSPRHAALRSALERNEGVQLLDIKPELDRLYSRYLGQAQLQTLLGALAVVVLIGLWLRSWRRLVAVCRPLLLAVLLTLGGLAVLQVPLGILHLVGLLLVAAVGSNYSLFFDMLADQPPGTPDQVRDTLASLLLANMTTVLSFALIAMSSIPALSAIGCGVAPGALLALLLSAAFARPGPRALADDATTAQAV